MAESAAGATEAPAKKGRRRGLLLAAAGITLLAGGGGAAFYLDLLPLPKGDTAERPRMPVFVEVPDVVANLNVQGRRPTFARLKSRIEVANQDDVAIVEAAMPRLLDMFTTYLRETRPEELRGSAGTHRLREELIARANVATRAGAVTDVLFVELVMQ
jgi:flagellar FliL protein